MKQEIDKKVTELLKQVIINTRQTLPAVIDYHVDKNYFLSIPVPIINKNTANNTLFARPLTLDSQSEILMDKARQLIGATHITNTSIYQPGSYMAWHTNVNDTGLRVYYTFTLEEAIFRYRDATTLECINDYDNIGWTCRHFLVDKEEPLWHCIWNKGVRYVFGFNRSTVFK